MLQALRSCKLPRSLVLTFSNGRVWLTYRSRESQIIVGCRINRDPTNQIYEEYNLEVRYGGRAKSSEPPALIEFQDRLYIFWKASVGARPGDIVYTSTEDGQDWTDIQRITGFQTKSPPAVATFGGFLFVASLANEALPARILITSTDNASSWSSPTTQEFAGLPVAKSIYAPAFTVYGKRLTMYWSGEYDTVYTAPISVEGINAAKEPITNNVATYAAEKIVAGKWQTKIGNALVYRCEQQWIITTTRDGEISIATHDDFGTRSNLTDQEPKAKSGNRVGACIIPGFFGRRNSMPWTLVLVYRGFGNDSTLKELYITL